MSGSVAVRVVVEGGREINGIYLPRVPVRGDAINIQSIGEVTVKRVVLDAVVSTIHVSKPKPTR